MLTPVILTAVALLLLTLAKDCRGDISANRTAPLTHIIPPHIVHEVDEVGFVASFLHGVASGDPLHNSIVIWTRVTPRIVHESSTNKNAVLVHWYVRQASTGADPSERGLIIEHGIFETNEDRDWTVKIDVKSPYLVPGVRYEYQFFVGITRSEIGLFSLPEKRGIADNISPINVFDDINGNHKNKNSKNNKRNDQEDNEKKLRYAVFSCSNWGWGYFHAYEEAARLAGGDGKGLDFFLHLGDYIYEYGIDHYPSPKEAVRYAEPNSNNGLQPRHEIVSLSDYRQRHALYRSDASLQKLTRRVPMIAIWDDHEIANDPWVKGAQNHQEESEGPWSEREQAAIRAYHEWMPTRTGLFGSNEYVGMRMFRKFDFGNLASLLVLESRLFARTQQNDLDLEELEGGGISKTVSEIIGTTSRPSSWTNDFTLSPNYKGMTIDEALKDVKQKTDTFRMRDEKELLGPEQLFWIKTETDLATQEGVIWQLYGQQTVMMNNLPGNISAALEDMFDNTETHASQWNETFSLLLNGAAGEVISYNSDGPAYQQRIHSIARSHEISSDDIKLARIYHALGYYGINENYDAWQGYLAERERFYTSIGSAVNPIVYAGDSHNAWAGIHVSSKSGGESTGASSDSKDDANQFQSQVLLNEFAGTSVTSPGIEYKNNIIDHELMAKAYNATDGNEVVYANTHARGFMIITLTAMKHRTEYIYVDNISESGKYSAHCEAAFEVSQSQHKDARNAMERIPCMYNDQEHHASANIDTRKGNSSNIFNSHITRTHDWFETADTYIPTNTYIPTTAAASFSNSTHQSSNCVDAKARGSSTTTNEGLSLSLIVFLILSCCIFSSLVTLLAFKILLKVRTI